MGFQHVENQGKREREKKKKEREGESEFTLHKLERYEGIVVLRFARLSPHLSNAFRRDKQV